MEKISLTIQTRLLKLEEILYSKGCKGLDKEKAVWDNVEIRKKVEL